MSRLEYIIWSKSFTKFLSYLYIGKKLTLITIDSAIILKKLSLKQRSYN